MVTDGKSFGRTSKKSAAPGPERLDPAALTVAQAARLLSAAGAAATEQAIGRHLADGAPATAGADGQPRINLLHYAARMIRRLETE